MNKQKSMFFSLVFLLLFVLKTLELIPLFAAGYAGFTRSFGFMELAVSLLSSLAAAAAGYWAAKPLIRYNRTHPEKKVVSRLFLILYFFAGCLFSSALAFLLWDNLLFSIFSAVLFLVCWLRFARYTQMEYYRNYSTTEYVTGSAVYILVILAVVLVRQYSSFSLDFSTTAFLFSYLAYTCSSVILLNQANIDMMMERRHHNLQSLPPRIRRYSLRVIGLLFLLLTLGFVFKNQILWVLGKLGNLLLAGIRIIITIFVLISKFLDSLTSSSPETPVTEGQTPIIGEEVSQNNFSEIIFWVLALAALVFFIIKIRKPLISWLKNLFMKIPIFTANESEDYTDQVKELNRDLIEKDLSEAQKRRKLKKEYRLWLSTRDPSAKVRAGYKLVLDTMLYRKMDIKKHDTAREITRKMENSSPGLRFEQETTLYEQVRYRLQLPSPEQTERFADAVSKIVSKKKNRPSG